MRFRLDDDNINFKIGIISVYLPDGVKKTFQNFCNTKGLSMSRYISRLVISEMKYQQPNLEYDYKTGNFIERREANKNEKEISNSDKHSVNKHDAADERSGSVLV